MMPIMITVDNEIYTINKEVFSRSFVYNFSTRYVVGADVFVRLNKDGLFDEKNFLLGLIEAFKGAVYPMKSDLKPVGKKFGVLVDGLNYHKMPESVSGLIGEALERGFKVEYAYDGVNIGRRGVLIEFKRFDPNLGVFTKVFLNVNGERKKWVGRDIAGVYDDIVETVRKVIKEP